MGKDLLRDERDVDREAADKICEWLSKQHGLDSNELFHDEMSDAEGVHPFDIEIKKKLSRVRPGHVKRLTELILCGMAFVFMSAFAIIIVDPPYNLVLGAIILIPFIIAIVERIKYGLVNTTGKKRKSM